MSSMIAVVLSQEVLLHEICRHRGLQDYIRNKVITIESA
jgi:hypothetical protein